MHLGQELLTQRGVGEGPAPERRHRRRVFLDTAHPRAQVRGLDVDGHAGRRDQLHQGVGDLLADALLDREALAEETDEPRQLRDTDDLGSGDVADVRDAVEGQGVVLAERVEGDRAFDDLAQRFGTGGRRFGGERRQQLRVAVVAGGRVEEGAEETLRRVTRSRSVGLEAERLEDLAEIALVAPPVHAVDPARRRFRLEQGELRRPVLSSGRQSFVDFQDPMPPRRPIRNGRDVSDAAARSLTALPITSRAGGKDRCRSGHERAMSYDSGRRATCIRRAT